MYFKTFKTSHSNFYVYEANRNSIYKINSDEYKSLNNIENNNFTDEDEKVLNKFKNRDLLKPMDIKKVEHNNESLLPLQFEKGINNIVLQVTQGCNLTCSYCPFADGNVIYKSHRKHKRRDISRDIIEKSIVLLEKHSLYNAKKYISFYGGEPLLRKDLIEFTMKKAIERFGKDMVYFGLTTNGTLLTEEFIEMIKDTNFNILVSSDGPEEIHDRNRKFINLNGSYNVLNRRLLNIKEKYPEIYNNLRFNVVIPPEAEYEKIFNFIRNKEGHLRPENTSLNTISSNYAEENISYDSKFFEEANYDMVRTLLFLLGKFDDDILIHKNNIDRIYMFKNFLKSIRKTEKISHPAGTCTPGLKKLFINVDGDFYPCEKANENSKIQKIGNINEGFDFDRIKYLMNIGCKTSNTCKNCWAFHLCSVCPIVADDGYSDEYIGSYKLKKCSSIKEEILNNLRVHCMLKENGFKYEEIAR